MGIKHFFSWFRREHPEAFININPRFDHVYIDMNGIIHEAAQYVYKYGAYENKRLLGNQTAPPITKLAKEVKKRVNGIIDFLCPNKSIFLAIDGVAPMSKQNQQRQRRFKSAEDRKNKDPDSFDSNCITAGTEFMKDLSNLLQPTIWVKSRGRPVEISTDSEPGEGEHKLIDRIRQHPNNGETHCVVGMDADLILLSLLLDKEMYISRGNKMIDIGIAKRQIQDKIPIEDFIVLSCLVGNDFLPSIPSVAIKDGSLQILIEIYLEIKKPLIVKHRIQIKSFVKILEQYSEYEKDIMDMRASQTDRFPNPLWKGDIDRYREDFLEEKFQERDIKKIVRRYISGLQWIYRYYRFGIPSWDWYYPYHYAPHALDIANHANIHIVEYRFKTNTEPCTPDEQLLRVLPPFSRCLLKRELWKKHKMLSTKFEVDLAGKHEEWEAVILVDFVHI